MGDLVAIAGNDYPLWVKLGDSANAGKFKTNPTIAAGDFKITVDGAAEANLTNLPAVTPAGSDWVKIIVDSTETSGAADVAVGWKDVAGAEWDDGFAHLKVQTADVAQHTVQDIWDALTSALTTVGSIGKFIIDKLTLVTSGTVTVVSPLSLDGLTLDITQGDDYTAANGTEIDFSSTGFIDLTSATVEFNARDTGDSTNKFTKAMTLISVGGATQTVRLELTAAETAAFQSGMSAHNFEVEATKSGVTTLVQPTGIMNVTEDISA